MRATPEDFDRSIAAWTAYCDRLEQRLNAAHVELALLEEGRRVAAGLVPPPGPSDPPLKVNTGTPAVEVGVQVAHNRDGSFRPVAIQEGGWWKTLADVHLVADEGEAGQTWTATLPTGQRCRLEVDLMPQGRQSWWLLVEDGEEGPDHA